LPEKEEVFNTRWLSNFVILTKVIMREWWKDPSKFQVRSDQIYRTSGIKKVYHLISAMMNQFYGRANVDVFLGTWVPIMYVITTRSTIFN